MAQKTYKSTFQEWHHGQRTGIGSFEHSLYQTFYKADQGNRRRLVKAFEGKYFHIEDMDF